MDSEIKFDERLTCDDCGRFGAMDFGEKKLCADCYGKACSCCPEFGRAEESNED